MSAVPEDICTAAEQVCVKLHNFMENGADIVAEALLAERERCAVKAEDVGFRFQTRDMGYRSKGAFAAAEQSEGNRE